MPAAAVRACRPTAALALWLHGPQCPPESDRVVHTSYAELETTPIQAGLNRAERGTIEIADRYQEGLDGRAEFDYAWLLTWLHKLAEPGSHPPLRHVPFLLRSRQRTKGIFATRGPKRINPIGLSLIQLLDVSGPIIRFAGVEAVRAVRQELARCGYGLTEVRILDLLIWPAQAAA